MQFLKILLIISFFSVSLLSSIEDNVIYVENLDSKELSLKDEFSNKDSNKYTIVLATIDTNNIDPIDFFKENNIRNAISYNHSKSTYSKIFLGVYNSFDGARIAINKLDENLKKNNPYAVKISTLQKRYQKNNSSKTQTNNKTKETNQSIFISNSDDSKKLKKELFNEDSEYYSIAVASIALKKDAVKNFFENNNISDKALAHVYGKNKDKVRIIYGLYKSRAEATEAIKEFNDNLKLNKPFSMKMEKFQSFYNKNISKNDNNSIIELKVNDKKEKELASAPELSDDIKIIKNDKNLKTKIVKDIKKETEKPKKSKESKESKKEQKKITNSVKNTKKKKIESKIEKNENKFLKVTKLDDVYFIESDGNFNILSEVFLNENSSFYTVDLGELDLSNETIEQYYLSNGLKDNSLAYKYGDKNEYARIIYGAYESKTQAKDAITKLSIPKNGLRVSNIKNHQKLYKTYHKDIEKKQVISSPTNITNDILYVENGQENFLKDEIFNRESQKYTITLITFAKEDIDLVTYLEGNQLQNNILIYSIGSNNDYYRLFYKVFDSFDEAKNEIENLDYNLKKNQPYISRISTNQNKFESYNNRKIEDYKNNIEKIDIR
ncbi:hypothetical protein ACMC56_13670 [Campylobacterota bacterium DY0563]